MATNEATNRATTTPSGTPENPQPARNAGQNGGQADGGDELKHHMNQLRDDFGVLRQDLMNVLESLFDVSKEKTGEAREMAMNSGKRAVAATESQIRERPVIAVLVAMVLGMILASFMGKSRS